MAAWPACFGRGASHKPIHPPPLPGEEQAFVRAAKVPLLGGVRGGFMVPRHAQKRKEALRQPQYEIGPRPVLVHSRCDPAGHGKRSHRWEPRELLRTGTVGDPAPALRT